MASGRAVFILYVKKRGAIAELVTIIEEIEVRYFSELAELRDVVLSDDQWSHQDPTKTLDQWLLLESRTTALLDEVDGKPSKQIRVIASQVEAQGFRNLVIDSAVVLVCLLIGLAVISILRKKRHLATHDALTGLPNRMQFEGLLQQDINGGKEYEYKKNKLPITTKPPHQNTYSHDTLTVRRLPIFRPPTV
jgi:GGDEF domain-containing protein